jgi:hypothetical protein
MGIWYSNDTIASEIEFVESGDEFVIIQRKNGNSSYCFKKYGDSVAVTGMMPNWPPLDCIINLLDNKTLVIYYFHFFSSKDYSSKIYSADMPITHPFIKDSTNNTFPVGVPFCVSYSHEEQVDFGAVYQTSKSDGELTDVFETNENYERDTGRLLERSFVRKHLLPDAKYIYRIDDESKDTLLALPIEEYLNSEFYALQLILHSYMYYAVVYERIFDAGLRSSEKYLCTFTPSGKYISRIRIASFIYSGTGISKSGARVPWFPIEKGCINSDLTINVKSESKTEKKFKIVNDGKIVQTK